MHSIQKNLARFLTSALGYPNLRAHPHVVTNLLWAAACCATHTGDLSVPNSDAIGLFPGLADREALFCVNFCLISRSLVEIGGWLHEHPDHLRLPWLRKAICCPNNGADVFFADYDYRSEKEPAPSIWFIRTPHFSRRESAPALPRRTVAVFNLRDKPRRFTLTSRKLGLAPGRWLATDVFSSGLRRRQSSGRKPATLDNFTPVARNPGRRGNGTRLR